MTLDPKAGVAAPTTAEDQKWQAEFDAEADAALEAAIAAAGGGDAVDYGEEPAEEPEAPAPDQPETDPAELAALLEKAKGQATDDGENDETDEETTEQPEEKSEEDKSATAAILRMLDQEKALREERDAFRSEREAFEAEKREWQEQQARQDVISADALRRVLMTDPGKLITALGIEMPKVSQLLIAAQLGDKAPAELKAAVANAQTEARIAELEAQLKQKTISEQARAEADKVRTAAAEYVNKGVSKDCPTVAEVAKVNRARVEAEIFQEICNDAAARARREPNGKPISFDEAARRVEKRWSEIVTPFKSQSPASTAAGSKNDPKSGAANAPKAATPALSPSKLTPKQPPKAPPAPSTYGLDDDWEAEAEAALRESLASVRRKTR